MTLIQEGFVSTNLDVHPEIYKSKDCIIRALREAVISELDATNMYEKIVQSLQLSQTDDSKIINELVKTIQEIADEEKKHVGEFQKLIAALDKDEIELYKDGVKE